MKFTEKKYHYVYRITNIITEMYYYGDRSCDCHPSEDIGIIYFSSFTNKFFKIDQINNPKDYKYKVIKIFESCREDAAELEILLHAKFNVKNHSKFINRANQTSRGFNISNTVLRQKTDKIVKNSNLKIGIDGLTGYQRSKRNQIKTMKAEGTFQASRIKAGNTFKENGSGKGNKHNNAKKINIFNEFNKVVFECHGNFKDVCYKFGLPQNALNQSYLNNGEKIGNTKRRKSLLLTKGFEKFIGWSAVKIID